MWYDKYPGIPPVGSPLETVFKLVQVQRKEADLLSTRALVLGALAQIAQNQEGIKAAVEAFQKYCDATFPFLEAAGNTVADEQKTRLLEHIKYPLAINTGAIRQEQAAATRAKAFNKYKLRRVEIPGVDGYGGTK